MRLEGDPRQTVYSFESNMEGLMGFNWKHFIKVIIVILQVIVLSMILMSIITTSWIQKDTSLGKYHEGLWQSCVMKICMNLEAETSPLKLGIHSFSGNISSFGRCGKSKLLLLNDTPLRKNLKKTTELINITRLLYSMNP